MDNQQKRQKRKYLLEVYEENYTIDKDKSDQECLEGLRDKSIAGYRVKTIKSGPILEVEAYPFWNIPQDRRRKKDGEGSSKAQKNLNDKNTRKHVARLINTNFKENVDLWMHLTYSNGKLPSDPDQAKKDMTNYLRRLKNWLKKQTQYKKFELKYIYVTEHTRDGQKVRAHHHLVTNFPDRDKAEELWISGGRANSRRLQPDDYGFEGIARYITKEKKSTETRQTSKRYTPSRNLKQPTVTIADTKLSRRRSEKIAKEEICAQELFEKMYAGYGFNDIEVKFSPYVSGAYLYVRMKKIPEKKESIKRRKIPDPRGHAERQLDFFRGDLLDE